MRLSIALSLSVISLASAWISSSPASRRQRVCQYMALDYNDPVVAEEYAKVQPMDFEMVEEELQQSGIRASPTMNDMDIRLMLVEVRLRAAGKMPGQAAPKPRPTTFSTKFEEALYTKPVFEEFYNSLKEKGDLNAMNVVAEYVNNPTLANQRYGKDYKPTIREILRTLNAPPPVTSTTLTFSGFPANMGEAACKMTMEAVGAVADFQCNQSEDFPVLTGTVTFEDIESAKKAAKQYHGMDMGMGTKLEMISA